METQVRQSSTMTDPSFEDTTSEQPYDTASEFFSQSLDTNIDSSNPGIVGDGEDADDADDKRASFQTPLTYDERHRRLSLSGKSPRPSIPQLSSLPTQIIEQPHSDNQASPETSIDLSNVSWSPLPSFIQLFSVHRTPTQYLIQWVLTQRCCLCSCRVRQREKTHTRSYIYIYTRTGEQKIAKMLFNAYSRTRNRK